MEVLTRSADVRQIAGPRKYRNEFFLHGPAN
jgi:hypothetical protein